MLSHFHLEMEQKELRTVLDFISVNISFKKRENKKCISNV